MATAARHLRPRDGERQETTTVELFFDLVYVFAITQLSHLVIDDLSAGGAARAAFLLVVVWWAWIYTTWLTNWLDPDAPRVRLLLVLAMLVSLVMAAAVAGALRDHGWLFAGSYVLLQVGRNVSGLLLAPAGHALRRTFARVTAWSVATAPLWLAGAALHGDDRLWLWAPALALELVAPLHGYRLPGRPGLATGEYDVDGGHFAERCQGFVIIALGEGIVVTGATATSSGLTTGDVVALAIAFLQTGALWWLYFGDAARHSRRQIAESDDPGRLARNAFTFGHVPIVAGTIAAAVGDDLLIAAPGHGLSGAAAAMVLGGPALFLAGESLFRLTMIGSVSPPRVGCVVVLVALVAAHGLVPATVLAGASVLVLATLAVSEAGPWPRRPPVAALGGG